MRGYMFLYIKLFFSGLVSFLILDYIWLGFFAQRLYKQEMRLVGRYIHGKLDVVWPAALLVYIVLIIGLVAFVYPRVSTVTIWWKTFLWGGFFGAICYFVYDFTGLAVLKNWSLKLAVIDTIWGFIVCGIVTLVIWFVGK